MDGAEYEVTFEGTASETLRAAFHDYAVRRSDAGGTVVRCPERWLGDVLDRVQSLGLVLVGVSLVGDRSDGS